MDYYAYRKLFGLTAAELEAEPIDQFFLNLKIHALLKDKERLMMESHNK